MDNGNERKRWEPQMLGLPDPISLDDTLLLVENPIFVQRSLPTRTGTSTSPTVGSSGSYRHHQHTKSGPVRGAQRGHQVLPRALHGIASSILAGTSFGLLKSARTTTATASKPISMHSMSMQSGDALNSIAMLTLVVAHQL